MSTFNGHHDHTENDGIPERFSIAAHGRWTAWKNTSLTRTLPDVTGDSRDSFNRRKHLMKLAAGGR